MLENTNRRIRRVGLGARRVRILKRRQAAQIVMQNRPYGLWREERMYEGPFGGRREYRKVRIEGGKNLVNAIWNME